MIKNYFKVAFRNLKKYKETSFINILGLAVGMAAFILLYEYTRTEWSYEDFHTQSDKIYRVTTQYYQGKEYIKTDSETFEPIGPYLKDQSRDVSAFVRFHHNTGVVVNIGDRKFGETSLYFADSNVFDVFGYELKSGNPQKALQGKNKVVISERIAKKYFGKEDALGKSFEIKSELSDGFFTCEITGVLKNVPANTHLKFNILVSYETLTNFGVKDNWEALNNTYTYLQLNEDFELGRLGKEIDKMEALNKKHIGDIQFALEPIEQIHLYSTNTFDPEPPGNAQTVNILFGIAILLLTVSLINYVNITTARSTTRAKEVGIRKVTGSGKHQLIFQFLFETLFISLLALFIALIIASVAMPWFKELSGQEGMRGIFSHITEMVWVFLIPIVLTLLGGIYPSLVMVRFEPALILKGKFSTNSSGIALRRFLSITQFTVVILLTICTLTIYYQLSYLKNKDLGIDIDQLITINATRVYEDSINIEGRLTALKAHMELIPEVITFSWADGIPGAPDHDLSITRSIYRVGQVINEGSSHYYRYGISEDFFNLIGAETVGGSLMPQKGSKNIILNEEGAKALGFSDPKNAVGTKIFWNTQENQFTISGVVKNFHQFSPKSPFVPMMFYLVEEPSFFVVKLSSVNPDKSLASVKKVWEENFPGKLFSYQFVNDQYAQQYRADERLGKVALVFTILTIFIAVLGLYGLISFHIAQKLKEISIRKVLGAPIFSLYTMLTKDIVVLIFISGILAIPSGYILISDWLEGFANAITLSTGVFIIPMLIILIVSLLTIVFQTTKVIFANPTETLQNE